MTPGLLFKYVFDSFLVLRYFLFRETKQVLVSYQLAQPKKPFKQMGNKVEMLCILRVQVYVKQKVTIIHHFYYYE